MVFRLTDVHTKPRGMEEPLLYSEMMKLAIERGYKVSENMYIYIYIKSFIILDNYSYTSFSAQCFRPHVELAMNNKHK